MTEVIMIALVCAVVMCFVLLWLSYRSLLKFVLIERDASTASQVFPHRQTKADKAKQKKREEEQTALREFDKMIINGVAPDDAADKFEEIEDVIGGVM